VTALAYAGIALFAVAVVVVAIGMSRQAVRYVRDVRSMVRAGTATSARDKQLEDVLSLGEGAQPDVDPPPSESEDDVPPGWGFR
jgi:hypothetical protein